METTDTLLDKLQREAPDNIILHVGDRRYLVSVPVIKLLSWKLVPDLLKDENSEEAKKHPLIRTGLKRLIAPYLPQILKKTQGEEVEIKPRLNILTWLPTYMTHFAINLLASKEWRIHAEHCEDCGEGVYRVVGISPYSHGVLPSPAESADSSSNRESVSGGRQSGSSGAADSDQSRRPMDSSGGQEVREEYVG